MRHRSDEHRSLNEWMGNGYTWYISLVRASRWWRWWWRRPRRQQQRACLHYSLFSCFSFYFWCAFVDFCFLSSVFIFSSYFCMKWAFRTHIHHLLSLFVARFTRIWRMCVCVCIRHSVAFGEYDDVDMRITHTTSFFLEWIWNLYNNVVNTHRMGSDEKRKKRWKKICGRRIEYRNKVVHNQIRCALWVCECMSVCVCVCKYRWMTPRAKRYRACIRAECVWNSGCGYVFAVCVHIGPVVFFPETERNRKRKRDDATCALCRRTASRDERIKRNNKWRPCVCVTAVRVLVNVCLRARTLLCVCVCTNECEWREKCEECRLCVIYMGFNVTTFTNQLVVVSERS